ncbi:glycosyltransferase family 2 protein [Planomonospora sp. ID82291]|nr:glycosyltransferase family 2 protein [Planomonospora sp. ID82291]
MSVAAPAYNEADNITTAITRWHTYLDRHPAVGAWEIVVCDDGSTDTTRALLTDLQHRCPHLVIIGFDRNRGAGAAIAAAIAATRHDWIVLLDSDGQFPITNLDRFLPHLQTGTATAFSGARLHKADTLPYRWGSAASGAVSNLLHRTRYRDFNSIFKVVRGPLLRALPLESGGMNCSTEITARLTETGHTWTEIPIEHHPRGGGRRGWRFWRGALDRALFVAYLGYRRWLLHRGVLRAPAVPDLTDPTATLHPTGTARTAPSGTTAAHDLSGTAREAR